MALDQIKLRCGIGAREPHLAQIIATQPDIGWLEVHPENYMSAGGVLLDELATLRALYPLSLHGVGLSLISSERLDRDHLAALKVLIERFDPVLVSEHLAWSAWDGRFYNDLLPVPLSEEALNIAIAHIDEAQDYLGRSLLIENPSLYGWLPESRMTEPEFLRCLAERTGCALLLDLNNVFVSAHNIGFDAYAWLDDFPSEHVAEMHIAGHAVIEFENRTLCIDDHGSQVKDEVWQLAEYALSQMGPRPILIEWDKNLPNLEILCAEADKAQILLNKIKPKEESSWTYKVSNVALPQP